MSLLNNFKSWLGELEIRFIYWIALDKKYTINSITSHFQHLTADPLK